MIVCEGEKTEPLYFAHFREALRGQATVMIKDTNDKDPAGLSRFARIQKERFGLSPKENDSIWIVFDADQNSQAQIDSGGRRARSIGAIPVMSNPCFELWYLLHFEDRRTALDRTATLEQLRNHLPDYQKNSDCFDELAPYQESATARGKSLEEATGNPLSLTANPSTGVWRLVEALRGAQG